MTIEDILEINLKKIILEEEKTREDWCTHWTYAHHKFLAKKHAYEYLIREIRINESRPFETQMEMFKNGLQRFIVINKSNVLKEGTGPNDDGEAFIEIYEDIFKENFDWKKYRKEYEREIF